jgi:hypothetical protein
MGKLAGLPDIVSAHDVCREAQLEIASTRRSMQIYSKMLLGRTASSLLRVVFFHSSNHPNKHVNVAWGRHDERALFKRFPEVCILRTQLVWCVCVSAIRSASGDKLCVSVCFNSTRKDSCLKVLY